MAEALQGIFEHLLKNQKTIVSKGLEDQHIINVGDTQLILKGKRGGKKDKRMGKV